MIVCYRREHALDAGAHLNINAHCFFEVDGLVFLRPFSVFFGGARDGCCSVDFRGAGDGFTGVGFGGARFGWLWGDCSSGLRSRDKVLEFQEAVRACAMRPISGFKVHSLSLLFFGVFCLYFVVYSIYTRTCIIATHPFVL